MDTYVFIGIGRRITIMTVAFVITEGIHQLLPYTGQLTYPGCSNIIRELCYKYTTHLEDSTFIFANKNMNKMMNKQRYYES